MIRKQHKCNICYNRKKRIFIHRETHNIFHECLIKSGSVNCPFCRDNIMELVDEDIKTAIDVVMNKNKIINTLEEQIEIMRNNPLFQSYDEYISDDDPIIFIFSSNPVLRHEQSNLSVSINEAPNLPIQLEQNIDDSNNESLEEHNDIIFSSNPNQSTIPNNNLHNDENNKKDNKEDNKED